MAKHTEKLFDQPPGYWRKLSKQHLQRAERLGVPCEYVDLAEVLRRDGLLCHLCGQQIVTSNPFENPGNSTAFHFDHIVSLARGGVHAASNIAVAHQWCNLTKELRERGQIA